jgi:transposase
MRSQQRDAKAKRLTIQVLNGLSKEQLIEMVLKLDERVTELERRLGMNSENSSKPPSSDPPWTKPPQAPGTERKPGGQPGHPGHGRKLLPRDQVDQIVPVKPKTCQHCGAGLCGEDAAPRRHQVTELPVIRAKVVEYVLHTLYCPQCGTLTSADLPPGVPMGMVGERLVAAAAVLVGTGHLSRRMTAMLLEHLFGAKLSVATVAGCCDMASQALAEPVQQCHDYVQQQGAANVDETGWREHNQRAWVWVMSTAAAAVFQIGRSRGRDALQKLLGAFGGILGSDRWGAYTVYDVARRQLCWAHLIRDFRQFLEGTGQAPKIGQHLLDQAKEMFQWWHRVRDGTMQRSEFQNWMIGHQRRVERTLRRGAHCGDRRTERTSKRILKLAPALWTFAWAPGVEPTNNAAERAIRPLVMWRKGCFGSHSEAGSRFVERMMSVTVTLKLQHRNVVEYVTDACHAHLHNEQPPSLLPATHT